MNTTTLKRSVLAAGPVSLVSPHDHGHRALDVAGVVEDSIRCQRMAEFVRRPPEEAPGSVEHGTSHLLRGQEPNHGPGYVQDRVPLPRQCRCVGPGRVDSKSRLASSACEYRALRAASSRIEAGLKPGSLPAAAQTR